LPGGTRLFVKPTRPSTGGQGADLPDPPAHVPDPKGHPNAIRDSHKEPVGRWQVKKKAQEHQQGDPGHDGCANHEASFEWAPGIPDAAVGAESSPCKAEYGAGDASDEAYFGSSKHSSFIGLTAGEDLLFTGACRSTRSMAHAHVRLGSPFLRQAIIPPAS